jgi:hypothetical protein
MFSYMSRKVVNKYSGVIVRTVQTDINYGLEILSPMCIITRKEACKHVLGLDWVDSHWG